jgi:hypothetical protein
MSALKYLSCILLFVFTSRIYSQIPDTIWTKTFGGPLADVGNSVKQTNDGGFIIAATTSSFGAGGQDIWLIKTDENGDTLWTKTFGGTGNDRASNVEQTSDNGYAVFGTTNTYGNGGDDFLLWKTDSSGNTEWYKTFDGGYPEYLTDGKQAKDNSYIILGNGSYPSYHAWLIKTDSSGNEIWSKYIAGFGLNVPFWGYSVIQTGDGGYAVCGYTHVYAPFNDWHQSILIKYSSTGDTLFSKIYDLSLHEVSYVVRETHDGNLILGCTNLYYDFERLLKVTQEGDIIWHKEIEGLQSPAFLNSLELDIDSGFIFSVIPNGNPPINPDFEIIKCDMNGNFLWVKRIGGLQYDFARSVCVTNDSGYILVGETKSFGAGDNDVWLMKFRYPPIFNVQINFFPTIDTAWVFGGCTGPDLITHNLVSTSERDSITIEPGPSSALFYYDSTGNTVPVDKYYFTVDDPLNQYDYELWFQPKSWPPFDPILIPFDSVFYFQQNSFDIKLIVKQNDVAIDSLSQLFRADWGLSVDDNRPVPETFSLSQNYPNPFNPSTKIKFTIPSVETHRNASLPVTLKVYDVLGNEIATLVNEEKQPGTYEVEFNPASSINPTSGIYFYQLKADNYIDTKKMVLIK